MVELLVFLLLCNSHVTKSSEISQPAPFLAAKLGDNVTVECHVTSNVDHMVWYKMTTGAQLNSDTVVQQPGSESVQLGDSVTLNCTIHTKTCVGEHSVYWFRHGSGESHPGIIYTHGDRSDQCEKRPEDGSPTQSCVYNLPKRNLSLSDAGTYYCAVASCGEILFGNGTKMDIEGNSQNFFLFVYCLGVALALSLILIIVRACIMYNMNQRKCLQCRGPAVSCTDAGVTQDADHLHYVALNLRNKKNRCRRQRSNMEEETGYSGI
ncbi:uncharacterized protein [Salvelinus sp. IW2-2015]|uniref:uncharacterized protein n=1 Tax=Salvelinus sp. IW2-2015 TaxID=2691554 RepID=UPI0038D376BD